jgi:hypothetical protein
MFSRLTEFELEDGSSVIVQTLEPATAEAGVEEVGRADEVTKKAAETLEKSIDDIRPAIEAVSTKIREMAKSADEVQVEFGITLSGELGGVIVKAGAEANFGVTLTWKTGP